MSSKSPLKILAALVFIVISEEQMTNLLFVVLCIAGVAFQFIPYFVARHRNHPHPRLICVLSVLLGWTLLGWVGCLIWACVTKDGSMVEAGSHSEFRGRFDQDWDRTRVYGENRTKRSSEKAMLDKLSSLDKPLFKD
jgi:Superinfection immunity protein